MRDQKEHPYVPKLKQNFAERKIDRREFLRTSTLLGVSAVAAYEFAGRIEGRSLLPKAGAADLPKGGHLRMAYRCPELDSPHTFAWGGSNYTPLHRRAPHPHRIRQRHPSLALRALGGERRPEDLAPAPAQGCPVAQRPPLRRRRCHLEPPARARPRHRILCSRPDEGLHDERGRNRTVGRQRDREGGRPHRAVELPQSPARGARAPLPLPAAHPRPGGRWRVRSRRQRYRALRGGRGRDQSESGDQEHPSQLVGRVSVPRLHGVSGSRRRPLDARKRAHLEAGGGDPGARCKPSRSACEHPARPGLRCDHRPHWRSAHASD